MEVINDKYVKQVEDGGAPLYQQSICERVPIEIWKKIFTFHENMIERYNFFPQNQKKLGFGKLRLVCNLWRDVIDKHVDFSFWLSNRSMENVNMSHVRVYQCKVTYFTLQPLPKMLPFRDPNILTKMDMVGHTSRENFLWLLDHSPNLASVEMKGIFLDNDDVLEVHNPEEESIIKKFWGRIQQLQINVDCKTDISPSKLKNLKQIMITFMPNLKEFQLYVESTAEIHDMVAKFLIQNSSVKVVEYFCLNQSTSFSTPAHDFKLAPKDDYERIQLETIRLSLHSSSDFGRQTWMSIISAQKSLVSLKITPAVTSECIPRCLHFDDFCQMIPLNFATLKYLDLGHLHYSAPLDSRIFERMTSLKSFKLHRTLNVECKYYKGPEKFRYKEPTGIINLECLPSSLEILDICDVKCEAEDLLQMAKAVHLKSLKVLELKYVGDSAVTPELVDTLVMKPKLGRVFLEPVGKSRSRFKTERKEGCYLRYVITSCDIMIPDPIKESIKWCKVGGVLVPYKCLGYYSLKSTFNVKSFRQ